MVNLIIEFSLTSIVNLGVSQGAVSITLELLEKSHHSYYQMTPPLSL
jgi:hypothetical protein